MKIFYFFIFSGSKAMTLQNKKLTKPSDASTTGKNAEPIPPSTAHEKVLNDLLRDPKFAAEYEKASKMTLEELNNALS